MTTSIVSFPDDELHRHLRSRIDSLIGMAGLDVACVQHVLRTTSSLEAWNKAAEDLDGHLQRGLPSPASLDNRRTVTLVVEALRAVVRCDPETALTMLAALQRVTLLEYRTRYSLR